MNKVCFLDRDGVLNVDTGYVFDWSRTSLLSHNVKMIAPLAMKHYRFCIITNQSGIGRGYFNFDQYRGFMIELKRKLKELNLNIDSEYFCPHVESDNCNCRKPNNGMFEQAFKENSYSRRGSIMIGDRESDLEAADKSKVQHRFLLDRSGVTYKDQANKPIYYNNLEIAFRVI